MKKITAFGALLILLAFIPHTGRSAPAHPVSPVLADSLPLKVSVYTTAEKTNWRISLTDSGRLQDFGQPLETQPCIFIDPDKSFQTFLGIGGAITDASAEVFARLPKAKQAELLRNYFDAGQGIGYTLVRTNIQSCDFSSDSYSYVKDNDVDLKSFSVEHDEKYRIPLIKQAITAAGGKLIVFATPWSPPAWMKDNHDVLHGGKLLPAYDQAWANFFVAFIKTYEKKGIPLWGLSTQNEPMASQTWESCNYTGAEERDFIKNFLGPTLQRAGFTDKKIIAWDHNRDLLYQRASTVLDDPDAAKYIWGIGFHWYESWTGGGKIFDNVKRVEEAYPNTHLLFTEGCAEKFDPAQIGDWKWGEAYGRNMIQDFNNGTVGWTDWNILLDEKGGPNHAGNFCFAPVHANTKTGELTYMNSFYYIGHFSRFIKAGAKRIISSSSRGQLITTAFRNPDGSIAAVVMNESGEKIDYRVWIKGRAAGFTSLPHSIQTLVLK
jgi:glucosylceramidase